MPDGGTKLPAALAIASEGALTLIGASLNKLVFLGDLAEPSTPFTLMSSFGAKASSDKQQRGSARHRSGFVKGDVAALRLAEPPRWHY